MVHSYENMFEYIYISIHFVPSLDVHVLQIRDWKLIPVALKKVTAEKVTKIN